MVTVLDLLGSGGGGFRDIKLGEGDGDDLAAAN